MLGGQSYDVDETIKAKFKREDFMNMYSGKTGALFQAALGAGAFAAGLPEETLTALLKCGNYLGVAFQLKDDLDDLTQDEKGIDAKEKKPCLTMLSTFTPESAREFIELERDVAIDTVRSLDKSENLVALIEWLLTLPKPASDSEKPLENGAVPDDDSAKNAPPTKPPTDGGNATV